MATELYKILCEKCEIRVEEALKYNFSINDLRELVTINENSGFMNEQKYSYTESF